ncbi:MAG TPA: transglycosylase domain-containing protein, partial [Myxococcota bacterium]|nr:transglycosylase domain-containing protein [Myxococcota bacterium]
NSPPPPPKAPRRRRVWPWLILAAAGGAAAFGWYQYDQLASQLPSVEALRGYQPATVTMVYAKDGTLLGEIYEKRRYVLPLEAIPKHVQNAFVAAEDGNFWTHSGVDYWSILRAVRANMTSGRISQGGSTITQQIAKNFLLTADRNFERKIKEAVLSWRIEETYSKEHILYLYLNEIFLGSQAYGVEAAARTFFGKHIQDVTLAEAAILAGLPPRPSDYNPLSNIDAALNRQRYVLERMVALGFVTQAEADAARAEQVHVAPRNNTFLQQTPHFTEYARRYLVERYGEERVLNEGLQVTTTCDPDLQRHAQSVVTNGVARMDERLGLRRDAIENLAAEADRAKRIDEHELTMRKQWLAETDPTGRTPLPERSTLTVGRTYPAVITQVSKRWAKVRVGAHEGVVPIAWSTWIYAPDPDQSWKWRQQDDLTRKYDFDGDHKVDGAILRAGDVVQVRVEGLNTRDKKLGGVFAGTPGEKAELAALRVVQTPEVESAMLSMELGTGAVRAMVGGADFSRSQLNRAVQAYRQVGSTFKPIVYAAAINSKKLTAGSVLLDAELAIVNELTDDVWKPQNYDGRFMGHMTLRKALALSRNVVTVRAMDTVDPSMRTGVVYSFARSLGIGGPPTHKLPPDWVVSPETDHLCPWIPETARMARSCIDRWPALPAGVSVQDHKKELATAAPGTWKCRECDLSIALGSASLTMEELARAYAVFGNGGVWLDPYYIEEVRDRDGNVLEKHEAPPPLQVISPELATIMTWLLEGVVESGTATLAKAELGMHIAGKTGTTNDEKDVWFVGYTPDVLTAVWVGYDQPRSLGRSSTGGAISLPLWIDYMRVAAPKDKDRPFPEWGKVEWATIDEGTGGRTNGWGRRYPFLEGTLPPMVVAKEEGDPVIEDLATEL